VWICKSWQLAAFKIEGVDHKESRSKGESWEEWTRNAQLGRMSEGPTWWLGGQKIGKTWQACSRQNKQPRLAEASGSGTPPSENLSAATEASRSPNSTLAQLTTLCIIWIWVKNARSRLHQKIGLHPHNLLPWGPQMAIFLGGNFLCLRCASSLKNWVRKRYGRQLNFDRLCTFSQGSHYRKGLFLPEATLHMPSKNINQNYFVCYRRCHKFFLEAEDLENTDAEHGEASKSMWIWRMSIARTEARKGPPCLEILLTGLDSSESMITCERGAPVLKILVLILNMYHSEALSEIPYLVG
jgi:hypothetical protein